jgi:hypothetical protein
MAEIVPIQGGPETAKVRNPVGVAALTIVTLGIYGIFWWYYINREMADLGRKNGRVDLGTNPALSVLAIFPGALLIVPAIWTLITTYQRAKRAQQLVGVPEPNQANPWFYGILYVLVSFVAYGYLQNELNKVWRLAAGGVAAAAPMPAQVAAPAPPVAPAQPAAAAQPTPQAAPAEQSSPSEQGPPAPPPA